MESSILTELRILQSLLSGPAWLVGGSVRDLLLAKKEISDIDLLTPSGSETLARGFADRIKGSFFFLDEERKITRVVKSVEGRSLQFDFTNFEGPDLQADLGRRDFTINAMALELDRFLDTPEPDGVIDLFNGRDDVRNKQIRLTREGVLDEDPLRMLRAVRFAATLGFTIEEKTGQQTLSRAALAARPAPERVRDELFLILSERGAGDSLLLMDSLGLLQVLLPEVGALGGFAPGMYHAHDVKTHSLKAVGHVDGVLDDLARIAPEQGHLVLAHLEERLEHLVSRKAALRFACLLHDIAKPESFTRDEQGHIHFYGHDNLGALKAAEICRRFRLSRHSETLVTSVIKQHMRLFNLSVPSGPGKNAMYRYCRDLGDALPESLLLSQADARATYDVMPREKFTDTEQSMSVVLAYYYEKFLRAEARPLLTGHDLIGRGFRPGPRFHEILNDVKERQAAGTLKNRQDALAYLDTIRPVDS